MSDGRKEGRRHRWKSGNGGRRNSTCPHTQPNSVRGPLMATTQPFGGLIRGVVGVTSGNGGEPELPSVEVGRTR